mmetsp:Transcript_24327/g.60958  ORF Transcript_24327/g.60958 Transcript_24327/m.60958 type:complete len:431 (+) Transcript_24327:2177-3469(+)
MCQIILDDHHRFQVIRSLLVLLNVAYHCGDLGSFHKVNETFFGLVRTTFLHEREISEIHAHIGNGRRIDLLQIGSEGSIVLLWFHHFLHMFEHAHMLLGNCIPVWLQTMNCTVFEAGHNFHQAIEVSQFFEVACHLDEVTDYFDLSFGATTSQNFCCDPKTHTSGPMNHRQHIRSICTVIFGPCQTQKLPRFGSSVQLELHQSNLTRDFKGMHIKQRQGAHFGGRNFGIRRLIHLLLIKMNIGAGVIFERLIKVLFKHDRSRCHVWFDNFLKKDANALHKVRVISEIVRVLVDPRLHEVGNTKTNRASDANIEFFCRFPDCRLASPSFAQNINQLCTCRERTIGQHEGHHDFGVSATRMSDAFNQFVESCRFDGRAARVTLNIVRTIFSSKDTLHLQLGFGKINIMNGGCTCSTRHNRTRCCRRSSCSSR